MSSLVYILGSGRCGSTVIERLLNSAPGVVGVGELHALWRLPMSQLLCACGVPVDTCTFWQGAIAQSEFGEEELRRLAELEQAVVRNRYLLRLRYDADRIRRDTRLREFAALQSRLLDGIRAAAGADTVVDSSKAGPRAWVLAAHLDPSILHVHRSAEDVIASWRSPKFEPSTGQMMTKPSLWRAAVDWVKAEDAARKLGVVTPVKRLNYAYFARAPKAAVGEVLPEFADEIAWTGERSIKPAAEYHSLLGNPDRFDRSDIVIRPQSATDRVRFGWAERRIIVAVGKTLSRAYP